MILPIVGNIYQKIGFSQVRVTKVECKADRIRKEFTGPGYNIKG